jgi:AmiR/NasT family two-component response regulator
VDDEGRQVERQLKDALTRRTTIGVAIGMLMERYQMDQDQAFGYLSRMSSVQNRKVYALAVELAETGRVPDADPSLLGDD